MHNGVLGEKMAKTEPKMEFWGLEVPTEYPITEHVTYSEKGKELTAENREAWVEFSRGIKATAYRFIAFKELILQMETKWAALELYPDHRYLFEQERDLLSLFVFGVSAIESTYYSLYVLATQANPTALEFGDIKGRKWGSDPRQIKKQIKSALGNVSIIAAIRSIERSANWRDWNQYRNQMFHSVASPRTHRLNVSSNPPKPNILDYGPTWCTPALLKNSWQFQDYLPWLSSKIARLMAEGSKIEKNA